MTVVIRTGGSAFRLAAPGNLRRAMVSVSVARSMVADLPRRPARRGEAHIERRVMDDELEFHKFEEPVGNLVKCRLVGKEFACQPCTSTAPASMSRCGLI